MIWSLGWQGYSTGPCSIPATAGSKLLRGHDRQGGFPVPDSLPVPAGDSEEEDLSDLSDVEVSQYLLSAEESKMKETVWTQMNQDYLDAQAIKLAQQAAAAQVQRSLWSQASG